MHQRVAISDHHLSPAVSPPPLGEVDPWQFANLDYSHRVACNSMRSFLYYIHSPRTFYALVPSKGRLGNLGWAVFDLRGPIADDEGRLWVRYVALSSDVQCELTEDEQRAFSKKLRMTLNIPRPIMDVLGLPKL